MLCAITRRLYTSMTARDHSLANAVCLMLIEVVLACDDAWWRHGRLREIVCRLRQCTSLQDRFAYTLYFLCDYRPHSSVEHENRKQNGHFNAAGRKLGNGYLNRLPIRRPLNHCSKANNKSTKSLFLDITWPHPDQGCRSSRDGGHLKSYLLCIDLWCKHGPHQCGGCVSRSHVVSRGFRLRSAHSL